MALLRGPCPAAAPRIDSRGTHASMANQACVGRQPGAWRARLLSAWVLASGCDALWDRFLSHRSRDAQGRCPSGRVCNALMQRCEASSREARVAGAAAGVCVLPDLCWENPQPQGNDLTAVSARPPRDIWAVSRARTVLRHDGRSWQQAVSPSLLPNDHLHGVHAPSEKDVWIVGPGDPIWYDDGTGRKNKTPMALTELRGKLAIGGSSETDIWAPRDQGTRNASLRPPAWQRTGAQRSAAPSHPALCAARRGTEKRPGSARQPAPCPPKTVSYRPRPVRAVGRAGWRCLAGAWAGGARTTSRTQRRR
jgi:hypothetical protein